MLARDPLSRGREVVAWAAASAAAALARLPSLRALPVFGDESIFLRLAALAGEDFPARLWISLQESQPPLHVWLLALVAPRSADPVLGGRLLSVLAGVVSVPAAAWTGARTLRVFGSADSEARIATWTTAWLAALAPFFVFAQRLARVDALFLLETVVAAGLSVALVDAAARAEASTARRLALAVCFGAWMAATMLTRQAVSYPLWLLAPVAWILRPRDGRTRDRSLARLAAALGISAAVALALWVPMLVAPGGPDTMTRVFHAAQYRPAMGPGARLAMTLTNVRVAMQAFWTYLTPPVVLLAAAGAAAARRRLLAYVVAWEALLLLPAGAFAASYFPRYALPAAMPICLLAGLGAARLWTFLLPHLRSAPARAAARVALAAVLCGPSIVDLARGERDWREWRLLPIDRMQFVSGPPAGFASEAAAGALRGIAAERPIVVLTPGISGNPTDAIWLLLGRDSRIRLSYSGDPLAGPLIPPPDPDGVRRLRGDARDPLARAEPVHAGTPVFAVVPDPLLTRSGWVDALPFLIRENPGIVEAARFENPGSTGIAPSRVAVLRLATP